MNERYTDTDGTYIGHLYTRAKEKYLQRLAENSTVYIQV